MKTKMNKKGMIFTILVISILSLFVVSYSLYSFVQNREAINRRIRTMNNYVFSLEQDLQRKVYISGYRSMVVFERKITEEAGYINSVDERFEELFFNGTYNGQDYVGDNDYLMADVLFEDMQESISEKAGRLNLNASLSNPEVLIGQDDPWNVKITLTTDLLINDLGNLAMWNRTAAISAYIPIENFEDSFYIKYTGAVTANKFIKSPYNRTELNDTTNLLDHATNSYYIESADAPSFLNRFEGDFSADSENGIESLVYLPEMIPGETIVDHLYFKPGNNPGTIVTSTDPDMPAWFLLDDYHKGFYGVS